MRLFLLLLAAFAGHACAADKYTVFPLGQPLPERSVICLDQEVAISGAKLMAANDDDGIRRWALGVAHGKCVVMTADVTYRKRVFLQDIDGVPFTVYQAEIQGVTVFVPMQGYRHDHPL